jgi:hypothetical protein
MARVRTSGRRRTTPDSDRASDPIRGIVNGLLLSVPLWAAIFALVRWAVR